MATPSYQTQYTSVANAQKAALEAALAAVEVAATAVSDQEAALAEVGPISSAKSLLQGTFATLNSYKNTLAAEVGKYVVVEYTPPPTQE